MSYNEMIKAAEEVASQHGHNHLQAISREHKKLIAAMAEELKKREWKPIESCPLNKEILVYAKEWEGEINGIEAAEHPVMKATTRNRASFDICDTDAYAAWAINPTHWQPLPPTEPTEE